MNVIDRSVPTPIRQQLRALLLERIGSGEYPAGRKFPAERVLAKIFGVSRTSIREATAELLSEGVLQRSARGTFVAERQPEASAAGTPKQRQIGFWINAAIFSFIQPGYNLILTAAGEVCRERGYRLQFLPVGEGNQSIDAVFAGDATGGLAGHMVVGGVNRAGLQRLSALPAPTQLVDLLVNEAGPDSVLIDYASGIRQTVEYLKELGHESIGFIGFPRSEKYEAYWRSLEACGLPYNPRHVQFLWVSDVVPGLMAGYQATQNMIAGRHLPTALLVTNDYVALGAMEALGIAGIRVPEEMSVIGCDDLDLNARPLTTIRADLAEVGRVAAGLLLDRIEGLAEAKRLVIPVKLIVRDTTAPPLRMRAEERALAVE